jgi:toxin ParE1/3/4
VTRVEFHPGAIDEFLSAVEFYEARSPGLGASFISAITHASEALLEFPERGHPFGQRLRRVLVRGFPYCLLYRAERECIYVVAVAHLNRRPYYWRGRA